MSSILDLFNLGYHARKVPRASEAAFGATRKGMGVAGAGAKATGKGLAATLRKVVAPGGSTAKKIDDATSLRGVPVFPLAVAGGLGVHAIANDSRNTTIQHIDPYTNYSSLQRLDNAYDEGVGPMSDSFSGFVRQKQAGLADRGMGMIDDALRALLSRPMKDQAGRVVRDMNTDQVLTELDPKRLLAAGVGAAGLGMAGALAGQGPIESAGYRVNKAIFPVEDRIRADEVYARSFMQEAGKSTAQLLAELSNDQIRSEVQEQRSAPIRAAQAKNVMKMIKDDPVLSRASESERQLMLQAYNSMQRYAPSIADDDLAVRNYLREVLVMTNGPDYGTISNLARAERAISGK